VNALWRSGAAGLVAALVLSACAVPSAGPGIVSAREPILAPDGILAGETGMTVSFGRAQDGAVTAVTKLVGAPPARTTAMPECGAGPVQAVSYPGGLTLNFDEQGFAGWVASAGARSWRGPGALRTGMGRTEIAALPGASFSQTSLGTEVEVGDVFGLIGPDDTLQVMFAGVTCFAR
jgi:hypothetical protein